MSDEHVIPHVLGGWVTVPYVCKKHNEYFGRTIESELKRNAYIAKAIDETEVQISAKAYSEADVILETDSMKLVGYFDQNGKARMRTQRTSDGLVVPVEEAMTVFGKRLEREGRGRGISISISEDELDKLQYEETHIIPEAEYMITKKRGGSAKVVVSGFTAQFPFRVVTKVALTHLSYFSRSLAMDPGLDDFKMFILSGGKNRFLILNEPIDDSSPNDIEFQPYHAVRFAFYNGKIVALVVLFGRIAFSACLGKIRNSDLLAELLEYYCIYDLNSKKLFATDVPADIRKRHDIFLYAAEKWHSGASDPENADRIPEVML